MSHVCMKNLHAQFAVFVNHKQKPFFGPVWGLECLKRQVDHGSLTKSLFRMIVWEGARRSKMDNNEMI